jgi:formamidase
MFRARLAVFLAFGISTAPVSASKRTVRIPLVRDDAGLPVPCAQDPSCHNRFHPAIPPRAIASPGSIVVFETRDALDNQVNRDSTVLEAALANPNRIHPLTGPVYVNGAQAGDVLEVHVLKVEPGPDDFGWTTASVIGLLRDDLPQPDLARWDLSRRKATTRDIPGVAIPHEGFAGVVGVAPSPELLARIVARERDAGPRFQGGRGGFVLGPLPVDAVPSAVCGPGAPGVLECLRTLPPRENGGNMDIKATSEGSTVLLPCFVEGCLLSVGDVHFAQGDGEVTGSAIEMNATVVVRLGLRKRAAFDEVLSGTARPAIEGRSLLRRLAPRKFHATVGYPLKPAGTIPAQQLGEAFYKNVLPPPLSDLLTDEPPDHINPEALAALENVPEDLTLAARDALSKMVEYIVATRGLTTGQAYMLASVAVDLRIGNVVDLPNSAVYAVLPLEVFDER